MQVRPLHMDGDEGAVVQSLGKGLLLAPTSQVLRWGEGGTYN